MRRLTLVAIILILPGCGSGDSDGPGLPRNVVAAIEGQLDLMTGRLDQGSAGACLDILAGERGPNIPEIRQTISTLPSDTDPDIVDALERSVDRLEQLVDDECSRREAEEEAQQTETSEEPPPPTDTETETETETVPETETETVPEPEPAVPDPTLPPGQQKKQEKEGQQGGSEAPEGDD